MSKRFFSPLYALPALCGLLLLALLVAVGLHMHALSSGKEIAVPAAGYDPRAVLLGNYVRLRPDPGGEITRKAAEQIRSDFNLDANRTYVTVDGWIVMAREGDIWDIETILPDKPELSSEPDRGAIKGVLSLRAAASGTYTAQSSLNIDRFYANQRDALAIEQAIADRKDVRVLLAVSRDGQARLKGISVDGERRLISWW